MSLLSNLFTVSSSSTRNWNRPTHRTTCYGITGGNSCCVCIPSSATCFIIEMWGQGGGGAGACCCMGACFGGQAGDYGWISCTTSGTNHALCVCVCTCNCCTPGAGLFTGSPGQITRVVDCSVANTWQTGATACGGSTCCFGMQPMNSPGCNNLERNTYHSNTAIQCCWFGLAQNENYCAGDTATYAIAPYINLFNPFNQMPFQMVQGTSPFTGVACACCTNFNFYVRGGCGWTSPAVWVDFASDQSCGYRQPTTAYCGIGWGRGGTAYAGGMGQCCDCGGQSQPQFGGVNGNTPGGGGSSASGTGCSGGCCLGSCGGLGLVLISYS